MIDWKTITVGLILALLLSIILGIIGGSWGTTIGFFLAAIYVGYSAGGDYTNGAVHGTIMSVIYGMIYSVILLITGPSGDTLNIGPIGLIIMVFIGAIIKGAIGGNIGIFIKGSNPEKDENVA